MIRFTPGIGLLQADTDTHRHTQTHTHTEVYVTDTLAITNNLSLAGRLGLTSPARTEGLGGESRIGGDALGCALAEAQLAGPPIAADRAESAPDFRTLQAD